MGDEYSIIMVKTAISQTGAGHRHRGVIAQQLQNTFVAGQLTTRRQGEGFKRRFCANFTEYMRQQVALIAILHTNMVETAAISYVDLQNTIGARAILTRLNQGDLCTGGHLDHIVNNCIGLARRGGVDVDGGRDSAGDI